MRINRLLLLPLLLLVVSCRRHSEVEIKSVCSRYFAASLNSTKKLNEKDRQWNIYVKNLEKLKVQYPYRWVEYKDIFGEPKKHFQRPSEYKEETEKIGAVFLPYEKAYREAKRKEVDLFATILKIQGNKDVDFYRQFISFGKKEPLVSFENEYDASDMRKFERKEKLNIDKAKELFSYQWSISNSFCNSYGVERY